MANISFRSFLPFVLPDVQGCSDIAAINAIRSSAIAFCEATLLWTWDYGPDDVDAGEAGYQAYGPDNAVVERILTLRYQGAMLGVVNTSLCSTATGTPNAFEGGMGGRYVLYPTPLVDTANCITGRVALKPKRDAGYTDEFLFNDWAETIGAGAKARLMSTPGKPWTAPDFSVKYKREFNAGVGQAKIAANKSMTTASLAVQMRPFA